jgi:response regulator RpfG family c-di-GMP phosphodiesterase
MEGLKHRSGSLFDPRLVDAFVASVQQNTGHFRVEQDPFESRRETEDAALKA